MFGVNSNGHRFEPPLKHGRSSRFEQRSYGIDSQAFADDPDGFIVNVSIDDDATEDADTFD